MESFESIKSVPGHGLLRESKLKVKGVMIPMLVQAKSVLRALLFLMVTQTRSRSVANLKILTSEILVEDDDSSETALFPAGLAICEPNFPIATENGQTSFPQLKFRHLSGVRVTSNRRFSSVLQGDKLLLPGFVEPGPWKLHWGQPEVAGILGQRGNEVLIRERRQAYSFPRGVFVGSVSPHNWYHWLIDTLPSVFLASALPPQYSQFPLLIPEVALTKPSWLEVLELLEHGREIVPLPTNRYLEFEDLVWIDSPTTPGPIAQARYREAKYSLHAEAMSAFRFRMLNQLSIDESGISASRKLYMARKQDGNRPYNQTELISVATRFGYEAIYFDDLSILETAIIMLETKNLIGPHGAGWASAIFLKEGMEGAMWTWPEGLADNWFSNIARLRNLNFHVLLTTGTEPKANNLDPLLLEKYLSQNYS